MLSPIELGLVNRVSVFNEQWRTSAHDRHSLGSLE
jgi:hypothetical protein